MIQNLRKCFYLGRWAEKQAEPTPAYKPTFRRKMTPDDLRVENLGKRVWCAYNSREKELIQEGIFVGYDASGNIAAEPRGYYPGMVNVAVEDCWIEMKPEED